MGRFTYCCVPRCGSVKKRSMHLSFFKFPDRGRRATVVGTLGKSIINVRRQWIFELKMGKKVNPYMKVCSLHFVERDFFPLSAYSKRRFLKPYAVPSLNLPSLNQLQPQPAELRKRCNMERSSKKSQRIGMRTSLNAIQPNPSTSSKIEMECLAPTSTPVQINDFATETISSVGSSRKKPTSNECCSLLSENTILKLPTVDSLEMITLNKSNSHIVAYTKLIPIQEGVQNLTQLVDFNSPSRVLFIDNPENALSANYRNSKDNCALEDFHSKENVESDCIIVEDENKSDIEVINKLDVQIINNPVNESSVEIQIAECNEKFYTQTSDFYDSEDTLSADENGMNDAELDSKPVIFSDLSSNTLSDTPFKMKTDLQEFDVKDELLDESSYSYYNLNTELIIKTEDISCNLVTNEMREKSNDSNVESTKKFLINNPVIFKKFCGLPSMSMFTALLEYVEDDMKPVKGVTKFEQLFSILAKLHKNEDNLYLNKYVFPPAYVYTVELLYQKLMLWGNRSPDFSSIPEFFKTEFNLRQKIVIVGTITVGIKRRTGNSLKMKYVKYLIAYTVFGEVFFVSNAFANVVDTTKLITYSGILKKLKNEHWILFHQTGVLYAVQARVFLKKLKNGVLCKVASNEIQGYSLKVVTRLFKKFKILKYVIPDFMLYSENGICFLDRLVFVCCMLLNMMPKLKYT